MFHTSSKSHPGTRAGHAGLGLLLSALACVTAGCRTPRSARNPVFYPLPPSPPRVQYFRHYSRPADLEGGPSFFYKYIVGNPRYRRGIRKPYGVTAKPGKWYVCDTGAATIHILDLVEKKWTYFAPRHIQTFHKAINMDVDDRGIIYVGDSAKNSILAFDPSGKHVGTYGIPGKTKATDVQVVGSLLYAADIDSNCLRVFDIALKKEPFRIPPAGVSDKARLYAPVNFFVDDKGIVHVSDFGDFRVVKYNERGTYISHFGSQGIRPGQFSRPKGITVDREGRIHVVDAATQLVQVFDADGQLLMHFGTPANRGAGGVLTLPAGIAIDYDNVSLFKEHAAPGFEVDYLLLVTSQIGPRKLNVYGFGRKAGSE